MEKKVSYRPLVTLLCPWCKLKSSVVEFENGDPGVIHTEPACAMFLQLDPLTYVRTVRLHYEKEIEKGKGKPN